MGCPQSMLNRALQVLGIAYSLNKGGRRKFTSINFQLFKRLLFEP